LNGCDYGKASNAGGACTKRDNRAVYKASGHAH